MKQNHSPFRYLPWFGRDVFVFPFRWFLIAIAVVTALVWHFASGMHLPQQGTMRFGSGAGGMMPTTIAEMIQFGIWNTCLTVSILMAVGGLVGTDLDRGYYRSYFSKPMSPVTYYLQRWLAGGVVIILCPLILGLGLAIAVNGATGISRDLIGQIALAYLLLGSAAFLASIFTSRGWLVVFLLSFLQGILAGLSRVGFNVLPGWLVTVHHLLPPFHLLQPGQPLSNNGDLRLVIGYGAGLLALAIITLRTRPLASGVSS